MDLFGPLTNTNLFSNVCGSLSNSFLIIEHCDRGTVCRSPGDKDTQLFAHNYEDHLHQISLKYVQVQVRSSALMGYQCFNEL